MKFRIPLFATGVLESVLFVVVATLLNTAPRSFFLGVKQRQNDFVGKSCD